MDEDILSQGEDIYGDAGNQRQGPKCTGHVLYTEPYTLFSFWSFKMFICEDHALFHPKFNSHAWHRILFLEFFKFYNV